MNWNNIFIYESGSLLWRERKQGRRAIAGGLQPDGYIRVEISGSRFPAHRIVWEMHNGKIPSGLEIDHINHNRSDNRIENLRLVSRSVNKQNTSKVSNAASKCMGVYWHEKNSAWRGRVTKDGKVYYSKNFSDWFEAVCWRMSKLNELKFHNNHGR